MPKKLAQIYHFDSFGKRQEKYDRLNNTEFSEVKWTELEPKEPYYFFVPKDFSSEKKYNEGFSVSEIFNINSTGITTSRDVFINDTQYFEGVSENVWEFYIGGYQPAQKWLKDRKGRKLGYEDILHYGKIIISLSETIRIMKEIEGVFKV